MKVFYLLLFLFFANFFHINGYQCGCFFNRTDIIDEEIGKNFDFITISLGCNCKPAAYTRLNKIRSHAFPFDWCLTPYKALYNFFEQDFNNFFKKEHMVPAKNSYFTDYMKDFLARMSYVSMSELHTWVLDKESGMIFNHDFPNNNTVTIETGHEACYEKYNRRIDRLYQEINSGKKVYFIRYYDCKKAEAFNLYQLLRNKFPQVSFTLIVIGNDRDEFVNDWNIPNIKNYYSIDNDESFWKILCKKITSGNFKWGVC